MQAATEGQIQPELWPARSFKIKDFTSLNSAWRATLITTGGEPNAIWKFKQEAKETEVQVLKRSEKINLAARGIIAYKTAAQKFIFSYIGPNAEEGDWILSVVTQLNIEEVKSEKQAAELLKKMISKEIRIIILALQGEVAKQLTEELEPAENADVWIVTLYNPDKGKSNNVSKLEIKNISFRRKSSFKPLESNNKNAGRRLRDRLHALLGSPRSSRKYPKAFKSS